MPNSKSEYRNPKQIRMIEIEMIKTAEGMQRSVFLVI